MKLVVQPDSLQLLLLQIYVATSSAGIHTCLQCNDQIDLRNILALVSDLQISLWFLLLCKVIDILCLNISPDWVVGCIMNGQGDLLDMARLPGTVDDYLSDIEEDKTNGIATGSHTNGTGDLTPVNKALNILQTLLDEADEAPRYLRIYWNDMTATYKTRAILLRYVLSCLQNGEAVTAGISKATLAVTQLDLLAPGVSPSGEYRLHPDWNSLRVGPRKGHLSVMGDFKEADGASVDICPRTLLEKTLESARRQQIEFTLGFEIELVLMRKVKNQQSSGGKYEPLITDGHSTSAGRAMENEAVVTVLEEAIESLDKAGVYIEMLHPESANGQFEITLPKGPALEAVDMLLFTRDVLSNHASAKGYRMTLHPKPLAQACGTAAHVHVSFTYPGDMERATEAFYAGVLKHLRAVCAFTYSNPASYERVVDGYWSGGTWIAWGTQNRETPLRKISGNHWEIRCMDGIANPYLALSALLSAGLDGIAKDESMACGDCIDAPAMLSSKAREDLGIWERLPASLQEALEALKEDEDMHRLLGAELVERYMLVKRAEMTILEKMGDDERRTWIMERY